MSAAEKDAPKPEASTERKSKSGGGIVSMGTNIVVPLILLYGVFVANSFRGILYPKFPDIDPNTQTYIKKYGNVFQEGDKLQAKLWVGPTVDSKKPPLAEFEFPYAWDAFAPTSRKANVTLKQQQLLKGKNVQLLVEVRHPSSGRVVTAKGGLVKDMKRPEVIDKYKLLSGEHCPETPEPRFGKDSQIGRGIPMMQVRLVFDTTAYPHWIIGNSPYVPQVFVDEFWITNDQLVKLNTTGDNTWETEVHFGLMSAARWRFQNHMERSLEMNAQVFGEDSEEMLQMRDLFANTSPWLLTATLVISVLHMVFEILAFKEDVQFFQGCDVETLNKYVSVQSIMVGIVMQILLLLYLWDESANFLVLGSSLVGIVIDAWKVMRAMKFKWVKLFGFIPLPGLESRVSKEKADDFDSQAMKYLTMLLLPPILGYCVYTLQYDCYKSWYSYFMTVSASVVYSVGFVLMTPQVFINYKHKTVAYLPWRKFIYRAITTFIDDLFAFIIRMPTMHRLSCFRDDIVFFIYLYQRHLYPVDKSRMFDDEGYAIGGDDKKDSD
eukprot:CAMPEP_0195122258 /NCGR_PEP_ID=MMETSP0448-20130528/126044_1 /TAXON_ID=66468 /ORGANISM="Heterocapsa triquestra, Strain CCMP 448" /LENGTH=548 /DNA_ID=CAMNT_0040159743 /DNA_START=1 /DNA_END=1645 /DNA_ORIENTATION=-